MVLLAGNSRVSSNESNAAGTWGYMLAQVYSYIVMQVYRRNTNENYGGG